MSAYIASTLDGLQLQVCICICLVVRFVGIYFTDMFGNVLPLLILFDRKLNGVTHFEIIEIPFDILTVKEQVVIGIFDESESIFQTQNLADLCRA